MRQDQRLVRPAGLVRGGAGDAHAHDVLGRRSRGAWTGTTVSIQDFAFSPSTLTVKAGTKVTWTNNDGATHDVASTDGPGTDAATTDLFASGPLGGGESFTYTFAKAGTYYYECTIHASMATMHATVIVK